MKQSIERQVRLERDMLAATQGARMDSWLRASEGGRAETSDTMKGVMRKWLPTLALGIVTGYDRYKRRPRYIQEMQKVEPLALALMAITSVLGLVGRGKEFTPAAVSLGGMVERELQIVSDDELRKKIERRTKGKGGFLRARIVKKMIEVDDAKALPRDALFNIGSFLIEAVESSLGIVHRVMGTSRKGTVVMLEFDSGMVEELDALTESLALDRLSYWPMVVRPAPWSNMDTGGYVTRTARRRVKLIRVRSGAAREKVLNGGLSEDAMEAVNLAQDTPWRINTDVLRAIDGLRRRGVPLPGCAGEKPVIEPGDGAEPRELAEYHKSVDSRRSQMLLTNRTLTIADRFSREDRIYYPHTMDWRGRLYPVGDGVAPQGSDLALGLLTFANRLPVGSDGLDWMAVHGANTYGVDKVAYADRIGWVNEHAADILDVVRDPEGSLEFWGGADKPYLFLAFCHEYVNTMFGDGTSALPVRMDATCSGIQHLAAIARDPTTARAVNLVDSETPNDVYGDVAGALIQILTTEGGPEARAWLDYKIDRKTTKRATMTLPYNSTQYSARQYVYDDLCSKILEKKDRPNMFASVWGDSKSGLWKSAGYLTPRLWKAIMETVPGVLETMDWLGQHAIRASAQGMHVEWTTPDGLLIYQKYCQPITKEVASTYLGVTQKLRVAVGHGDMVNRRQRSGLAPNFVHSMDATMLRTYVRMAAGRGITSHALVHDSIGTHAANVGTMQDTIREAFVEMYEHDVTEPLMDWARANGIDTGEPLQTGGLDIRHVLDSSYFCS